MTDLKREDVARVLARILHSQIDPLMLLGEWESGYQSCANRIVADLNLRPEFDAALAEMEKEQGRG